MQLDIEQVEQEIFHIKEHEAKLLDYLCLGLSNKEIGERLGLSEHTVSGKMSKLGRYFGINVKRKHLNVTLATYWNCELFRKGLTVEVTGQAKILRHKITSSSKRIERLKGKLSDEMTRLLLLEEEYKQISNSDVVDRRPTVCQVG